MRKSARPARVSALLAVGVLGALTLSACGSNNSGSGSTKGRDYVIGFNDDLSGPISFAGLSNLAGVQTYFDYVNAQGGVNGHKIVLKTLDTKANGATALANARQLVQDDHAIAIMGNSASSAWVASGPLAYQQKVLQIGYGNADKFFTKYNPYLFKNGMVVTQQVDLLGQVVSDYLFKGKSGLKVGILASDTASGPLLIGAVNKLAASKGWSVAVNQTVAIGATDCTAQASKLAAAKPDVILSNVTSVGEDIVCFKQLKNSGYIGPLVNTNSSTAENTYKTLASPNWISLRSYPWWQDSSVAGNADMAARAMKYGTDKNLGPYSSDGYVAATAITQALKACGTTCDGTGLQKALEGITTLDTNGMAGPKYGFTTGDLGHTIPQAKAWHWDAAKGKSEPLTDWLCVPNRC